MSEMFSLERNEPVQNLFGHRDNRAPLRDAPPIPTQGTASPHNPLHGPQAPHPAHPPRPAQQPVAAPANENVVARAEPGGSKLIVGPNIKLRGVEIDDCDTLVVEGRVEATMVSRTIQIAEGGSFSGKVDVDLAEIHGEFKGELTARRKLVVHTSGVVSGKIRYGKMQVNEGGVMSGDIGSLEGSTQPLKQPG
jgi:cytoskeletal protein CcmA (bactofilin family)